MAQGVGFLRSYFPFVMNGCTASLPLVFNYSLLACFVGTASEQTSSADGGLCSSTLAIVQSSLLLQATHSVDKQLKETTSSFNALNSTLMTGHSVDNQMKQNMSLSLALNSSLDHAQGSSLNSSLEKPRKPKSSKEAAKKDFSLVGLHEGLPILENIQNFFMMLIFGTATLAHHQKVLLCVFFGVASLFAIILIVVVYLSSGREATADRWRLPPNMDPRLWAEAVDAYRCVVAGRRNSGQQPKESSILKSAIAQAEVRDGATASSSHEDLPSKMQPSTPTTPTEEDAEWLRMVQSTDDDRAPEIFNQFLSDGLPKRCEGGVHTHTSKKLPCLKVQA